MTHCVGLEAVPLAMPEGDCSSAPLRSTSESLSPRLPGGLEPAAHAEAAAQRGCAPSASVQLQVRVLLF